MKKLFLMILAVAALGLSAKAGDYSRDENTLPQAAILTINNNFNAKVGVIKTDRVLNKVKEYEVTLADGTRIDFDERGNWKDIEMPQGKAVPEKLIPESIRKSVGELQHGQKIVGVERRGGGGYEIELANGIEMRFDKAGQFEKYD